MPNWTTNQVTIEGDEKELNKFIEFVKSDDNDFDFDKIIPMPKILKTISTGSNRINGDAVSQWVEETINDKVVIRKVNRSEQKLLKEIGYSSWYPWASEKWGTKWNTREIELNVEYIEFNSIEYIFDTAWSAPEGIHSELIQLFPNLDISWRFRNEDDPEYPHEL